VLSEQELELAFEQMELLGFPLCNPFDLLNEQAPAHTMAKEVFQHLGLKITTYGYLVALKKSYTSKGDPMYFGTFIDRNGDILDTVHFPEVSKKYPFYGKGIYRITGVISEEFGYYTVEVGEMEKQHFMEDVRFSDEEQRNKRKEESEGICDHLFTSTKSMQTSSTCSCSPFHLSN
jgi:DNA polymerase III alpha subunit